MSVVGVKLVWRYAAPGVAAISGSQATGNLVQEFGILRPITGPAWSLNSQIRGI